jgi:HlyD family secretion protein
MTQKRLVLLIAMVLVLLLGFSLPRWIKGPRVAVVELQPRDLTLTLVVNGRVLAPRQVQLGAMLTGVVARRLVEEGDQVEAGAVLLELDSAEARANLAKAEAELAKLRQVTVVAGRYSEDQAESTLRLAQWTQDRNQQLYQDGIIAQSVLEDSTRALELARAARMSAGIVLESARSGSDLHLAQANCELARVKLSQTRVLSPAKGVVLTRSVEEGDLVSPGRTLLTLALDEPLQILIQPDERYLSQLEPGLEARVGADSFPQQTFDARIIYIAPGIDATRGTVDVRLALTRPPDFLRPDMTVSVEVLSGQRPGVLVIPLQALRSGNETNVLVLRSGRAERVRIVLGARGETEAEVRTGLSAGDQVILSPAVREGQRCRPAADAS